MSSSTVHRDGVAAVLAEIETRMREEMHKRLDHPSIYIRSDLSEEERDKICELAATLARKLAGDGVAQAYQLGVNRNATDEQMNSPTIRVTPKPQQ